MEKQIKVDKDYTLVVSIMQVADILVKVRERELLPHNLSATAAEVLFLVKAMGENVTPATITRMMMQEHHSISGILVRMEKHGLLNLTKDMERKNHIRVTLTAKGEKALNQVMKLTGTTQLLAKLTVNQRSKLEQLLTVIKEAGLKELYHRPKVLLWP